MISFCIALARLWVLYIYCNNRHCMLGGLVLLLAQFFGIMPLYGLTGKTADRLQFTWFNLRMLHSIIIMGGNFVMMTLSLKWVTQIENITISDLGMLPIEFEQKALCQPATSFV